MPKFCFICSINDKKIHSNINFKHYFHKKCFKKWLQNDQRASERIFSSPALNVHDFAYLLKGIIKEGNRYDLLTALYGKKVSLLRDIFNNTYAVALLSEASKRGRATFIEYFLENGLECADLNLVTSFSWKNSNSETLITLMLHGSKIDTKDHLGRTVLHKACVHGFTDFVSALLDGKRKTLIDVNSKDFSGYTSLYYAMKENHYKIVEILIQKGADREVLSQNISLLFEKMSIYIKENLKLTHANQEDLSKLDKFGKTALHYAAASGLLDIVKYLIEDMNIFVDIRDHLENTPLHYACKRAQLSVASYLIKRGADVNAIGESGETPILMSSFYPPLEKYLKEHGAVSLADSSPVTPCIAKNISIYGYKIEFTWHNFIRYLVLFIALFIFFKVVFQFILEVVVLCFYILILKINNAM